MSVKKWQLTQSIDAVVFDCDGTLSAIEGIDELAKLNHLSDTVTQLTSQAMSESGLNATLYAKRLDLARPLQRQVAELGAAYAANMHADTPGIIQLLQRLNKPVFIVSAGLYPAIVSFAAQLGIPKQRVFAVDIYFDIQGYFTSFDTTSPLINSDGKYHIVGKIQQQYPRIVHIGDGSNDYVTHDLVTRFIGYGGIFYRPSLAKQCAYYLTCASLAPILPLSLTQAEYQSLSPADRILVDKGLRILDESP